VTLVFGKEPFAFLLWHGTTAEHCVICRLRGRHSVVIFSFKQHCAVWWRAHGASHHVVKSRQERYFGSLHTPFSLLHLLYYLLCSQSFGSGTAAAATADDHHSRCGAQGRPEAFNTFSHTHRPRLANNSSFSSFPRWQCVANVRRSHPGLLVGGMFYFRVRRVVFGQAGNRPLLYLL